jgi:hypothetical protein
MSSRESARGPRTAVALGAVGLFVTLVNTVRLFLKAPDHSLVALVVWGVFALWLPVPFVWALRRFRRLRRLGPDAPQTLRDELLSSTAVFLSVGYGTAAFALNVIQVCVMR